MNDDRKLEFVEIGPAAGFPRLDVRELWNARGLFVILVWRDLKIRYAQTVIGIAWVLLQPLATTVLFWLVFGRMARLPSDGVAYFPFALVGLIVWMFVSSAVSTASTSVTDQSALLGKIYFPRLFVPFASIVTSLLDAIVALVLTVPVLFAFGVVQHPARLVAAPLFLLLALVTAAGIGALLAALQLRYRDFRYLTPFLLQLWLFGSPVVYPGSSVPDELRTLYALNPLSSVIAGMRWSILGAPQPATAALLVSITAGTLLLLGGALYFRWAERTLADVA